MKTSLELLDLIDICLLSHEFFVGLTQDLRIKSIRLNGKTDSSWTSLTYYGGWGIGLPFYNKTG